MNLFAAAAAPAMLDAVFFALSDATRRGLLERLRGTEETAGALARGFEVTRPAVSRHLRILREAELVEERRRGRERVYTLAPHRLAVATEWLDGYRVFWGARLRELKDLIESLPDDIASIPNPLAASGGTASPSATHAPETKAETTMTTPVIEHRASFPLPATPERAFSALVDPAQLARWFAETVRVEPSPGGAFQFSGRGAFGTPKAPNAGAVAQTITALEPGRAIAFGWTIHGVSSQVRWTITADEQDADGSRLAIEHYVFGALPIKNAKHAIDDLWRLHAGNLMEHLRGGTNVVLADFASDKPEIRLSVDIDAPPAKVFRALLVPELMNRWLGGAAKVDVEKREISYGWRYEHEGRSVEGGPTRILELVENQRLVTDWPDWRGDPEKPSTRVIWDLQPLSDGARTRLTIVHDGFEQPVDRSDYQQGWSAFTGELAKVAASA